jgi:hypothetical protein
MPYYARKRMVALNDDLRMTQIAHNCQLGSVPQECVEPLEEGCEDRSMTRRLDSNVGAMSGLNAVRTNTPANLRGPPVILSVTV